MSSLPAYYIPKDGPLSSYKEYITMLPNIDHPGMDHVDNNSMQFLISVDTKIDQEYVFLHSLFC